MTELENKVNELDKRQESFETYVKMYMEKTDELIRIQKEEMREFKAKHEADMARIDAKFDKIDAKFDKMEAKMDKMMDKIDGLVKYVQSMAVTAMIGMLGIAGSVVYFVYSVTPKP